jgi:tetratricopeptide (TPR) repeat protein
LKWIEGKLQESTELYETAYKLDPMKEENVMMLGQMYESAGRVEDALKLWSKTERLFPQTTYAGLTWHYISKSDLEKANEYFEKFRAIAGSDSVFTLTLQGVLAASKGRKNEAREAIAELERTLTEGTVAAISIGMIYYVLGDMDMFFKYLYRDYEIHALNVGDLVNWPFFAKAREDPRLKELLKKLDLDIDYSRFG